MNYEKDMKATWDAYATRMTLEQDPEEAIRVGKRIGLKRGWQDGFKQGWDEGLKEGIEKKSIEGVKNLLTDKFTIVEIAKIINVPKAFVVKVKKSMQ